MSRPLVLAGLGLLALALGPCGSLLAERPLVEVRKPAGVLHAGLLPGPDAPLDQLPGQGFHIHGGWIEDGVELEAIEVRLGSLGPRGQAPPEGATLTLILSSRDGDSGPWRELTRVTVDAEGPGWTRFPLPGGLAPRRANLAFHLAAEGQPQLVPWIRTRGRMLVHGGWGSQAKEVGALRGELVLRGDAPPTALLFPALSLGAEAGRHARLRLVDPDGVQVTSQRLPAGLALGTTWLWFALHAQPTYPDGTTLRYELDLPAGTVLVGSGGSLRPTVIGGVHDPAAFPAMGFVRGEVQHDDRDLLFRVWGSGSGFGGLGGPEGEGSQQGSDPSMGLALALAGAALALGAASRAS